MTDYAKSATAARLAVTRANAVCRQVQAALDDVRSITKDDKSPVTVADFASQAIVSITLRDELHSGDGSKLLMVAEETSGFLRDPDHAPHLAATLAAAREIFPDLTEEQMLDAIDLGNYNPLDVGGHSADTPFWALDPIDGTKGFLRGQQYAVALGLVEDARPVIGVMGCPNLPVDMSADLSEPDPEGCLYWAIRGDGVYETSATDPFAESIRITRLDHADGEPICVTGSVEKAHSNQGDMGRILEWITSEKGAEVGEPVRLDSQCKYAVVARGQADAYLRLPAKKGYVEKIWDHAAGAMIAAESGAAVTDIFGRELDFGHGAQLEKNKGIVCAPPRLHGLMIAAIQALGIKEPE
ncbi:MAG: HAL2 family 3'(2'),5'-bisphosphate nucleotidase [Phycisphaerales bacterium]|jgi:HAL2 family 3'(2'),5'-bisphosphate nucleotidase